MAQDGTSPPKAAQDRTRSHKLAQDGTRSHKAANNARNMKWGQTRLIHRDQVTTAHKEPHKAEMHEMAPGQPSPPSLVREVMWPHKIAQGGTRSHKTAQDRTSQHKIAQDSTRWHKAAQDRARSHKMAQTRTKLHKIAQASDLHKWGVKTKGA